MVIVVQHTIGLKHLVMMTTVMELQLIHFTLTVQDAAGNTSTDSLDVTIVKADDETPTITSFSANNTNVALYSSSTTQLLHLQQLQVITEQLQHTVLLLPHLVQIVETTIYGLKHMIMMITHYGSHSETLTVTFTDAAGNSSTATASVSITKSDDLAPTITSFSADDTSSLNYIITNTNSYFYCCSHR